MATSTSNLVLKGTSYFARFYIPVSLQKRLGRAEVWKSLDTSNFKVASKKLIEMREKMEQTLEFIKNGDSDYVGKKLRIGTVLNDTIIAEITKELEDMFGSIREPPDLFFHLMPTFAPWMLKSLICESSGRHS